MRLFLVRHGHAGRKVDWPRADRLRPLSPRGQRQAKAVATIVAPLRPSRIFSSPYVRCVQTMEPLADELGIKVENELSLGLSSSTLALRFLRRLTSPKEKSNSVLCTHGEVMEAVLRKVAGEDGNKLAHRPPGVKGCVWVLEFRRGKLVASRYIPPPDQRSTRLGSNQKSSG